MNKLLYNDLYLSYLHIFNVDSELNPTLSLNLDSSEKWGDEVVDIFPEYIDCKSNIVNYDLPPIECTVRLNSLNEPTVEINTTVLVRATVWFGTTVVVKYLVPLPRKNRDVDFLNTDQLIELASAHVWKSDFEHNVLFKIKRAHSSLELLGGADCGFDKIRNAYRRILVGEGVRTENLPESLFAFFDVRGGLSDVEDKFKTLSKEAIVVYIKSNMSRELNGLLTLTPYEWAYGKDDSIDKTSSGDIALDSDELVFLNQNVGVFFGLSWQGDKSDCGGGDWSPHFLENNVSFPELLAVTEASLVKKQNLNMVTDSIRKQSAALISSNASANYVECALSDNASKRLRLTNMLLNMNELRIPYLNYMSNQIDLRFDIDKQLVSLDKSMKYVDDGLLKLSDAQKLRQAHQLNVILALLSSVSVLGLLFQQIKPPFIQRVLHVSDSTAESLGTMIIACAILIIAVCLLLILRPEGAKRKASNK